MDALFQLKHEHDIIERVLNLLQKVVSRIESGQEVPEGFELWSIEFLDKFAHRCHHTKEDDVLFPLLEERGLLHEDSILGPIANEHVEAQGCVWRMAGAAKATPIDRRAYAVAASEFVRLLRRHIAKENDVLFPLARQRMKDKDFAEVAEKFHTIDQKLGGPTFFERYELDIKRWEEMIG